MPTQSEFYELISAHSNDLFCWLLWADWLEENGSGDQAELIRLRSELTNAIVVQERRAKEARLRQLVYIQRVELPAVSWHNSLGMAMHLIPAGEFIMGSPESEVGRYENESQVKVRLNRFWIAKNPVTQGEYLQVMNHNPSHFQTGMQYPVESVSYTDATLFCQILTQQERDQGILPEGWQYRLPSEAQWEYACRAGTRAAFPWREGACPRNFARDQNYPYIRTYQVGLENWNAWGLYDVVDNVFQWCFDAYQKNLPGGTDPIVLSTSYHARIFRGSSWGYSGRNSRLANRNRKEPGYRNNRLGFRVALVPLYELNQELAGFA